MLASVKSNLSPCLQGIRESAAILRGPERVDPNVLCPRFLREPGGEAVVGAIQATPVA